jgi:hypothetical protein
MPLSRAEQEQIEQFARERRVTVCPRVNPLTALSMTPNKQQGRGNNGRYRRGARTMSDAISLPDVEHLPEAS